MRHDNTGFVVRWYELGLELLDSSTSVRKLKEIKADYQNVTECCIKMFEEWLAQQRNANWNQLIIALNNISMNTAAEQIKENLKSGMLYVYEWNLEPGVVHKSKMSISLKLCINILKMA